MKKEKNPIVPIIIAVVGVIATMVMIVTLVRIPKLFHSGENGNPTALTQSQAEKNMSKYLDKVKVLNSEKVKGTVDYSDNSAANLPNIETKYPLTVIGNGDVDIEIFSTSEKAGKAQNGWLNEVANEFNDKRFRLSDNRIASVSVRSIASGAASDYICNNVYVPQAYTPSNTLFGELAMQNGAKLTVVEEQLVPNTAGIALSKTARSTIETNYGSVTFESVVDSVVAGDIQMGYTYPYTSATGLNFLVSSLQHFDANDILSADSIAKFQQLQKSIPFVCYTTDQMVNAMQSGTLQAGVTEYQAYVNSPVLKSSYDFIPFGYKHSNPLYKVGDLDKYQNEVLTMFADFAMQSDHQKKAADYGFDPNQTFSYNKTRISGADIISAQRLWKEEKDSGTPTIALFIADVSGSMNGDPIIRLKQSLLEASKNIKTDNYVGLISYSDDVYVNLPIAQFDLEQRSYFAGAVEKMKPNGSTATYDALLVGIKMINEYKEQQPDAKTMIFVLSDGMCNKGVKLDPTVDLVEYYGIPIYTIGYNEQIDSLKKLSAVNEAVYIDADNDDVVYELAALFNAQM